MAPILTPKDVVRRIAAECTSIDDPGTVDIALSRPQRRPGRLCINLEIRTPG
jgi:hypothetical protein